MTPLAPNPRQLLAEAGLSAKKSWGQNFLRDQTVLAAIAHEVGAAPGQTVLELGAGLGALTHHLLVAGATVRAVERDRDLVPLLRRVFSWADDKLVIIEADAAKFDYVEEQAAVGSRLRVCGNLPYQLSGRILVSLAAARPHIERAVLLVQKEVGARLVSPEGTREYGLLSVLVQRAFATCIVRAVSSTAFFPRPKVDSAVVYLSARADPLPPAADAALVATAKAAFGQRRKTLKNALAAGLGANKPAIERALVDAGIDPRARAETLGVAQFAALGVALDRAGLLAAPALP